jgi:integrin-linked kinase-associated serine/threonine phosphatase 2C
MNFFGGGAKTKKKKDSKKNDREQRKIDENKLNEIIPYHFSMRGQGTKKIDCQDAVAIVDTYPQDFFFLAVLDGHGSSGREASTAASDNFQHYFIEKHLNKIRKLITNRDRETFLQSAFKNTEKKLRKSGIDYSNSGTCCVSVFFQGNNCTIANLGDSRAVLCRWIREKIAIELSTDHKPTNREERIRIIKKGGKIERMNHGGVPIGPMRVWADDEGPGIAMTRTLGDLQAKKIGLISEPEVKHIELKPGDRFIVVASDGLWDVMDSAEVVGFILKQCGTGIEGKPPIPQTEAAQALVKEARGRWEEKIRTNKAVNEVGDLFAAKKGIDDITAIVAFLKFHGDAAVNLTEPFNNIMMMREGP